MNWFWAFFCFFFVCPQAFTQTREIKGYEQQLGTLEPSLARIDLLNQCARYYMYADPKKALTLASEAIQLADSLDDKQRWAYASMYRGETLIQTGVYPEGRGLLEAAIVQFTMIGDSLGKGQALSMLGFCMNSQGQFSEAFTTLQEAYTYLEPHEDLWSMRLWHNNMFGYHNTQGNHVEDLAEIRKALEIANEMRDTMFIGTSYYNLALSYWQTIEDSLAELYFQKSLHIAEQIQNYSMIAWNKGALGELYWHNMQPQKGFPLIQEAYDLFQQMDDQLNISYYASSLAFLNANEGNNKQALTMAQTAVEVAHKTESVSLLAQAYYTLGFVRQRRKEFELALQANKKFHHYQDSLISQKKMFTLDSLQNVFANKEAELEKEMLQKEIDQRESQAIFLTVGILLAVVSIGILLWINRRLNRKRNLIRQQQETLQQAHQEVQRKNDHLESIIQERTQEIEETNSILQRRNHELGQFVHMASHEFQQPISLIAGYVIHIKNKLGVLPKEKLKEYLERIERANERKRDIIRDFLAYTNIARQDTPQAIDGNQVLAQTVEELRPFTADIKIALDADPLPHLYMSPQNFKLLLFHLLQNAIIHGPNGTPEIRIKITSCMNASHWMLSIFDSGGRIPKEYQERIFQLFQRLELSKENSGSGVGLSICKKIMETYGGAITLTSERNAGTTFDLQFPIGIVAQQANEAAIGVARASR